MEAFIKTTNSGKIGLFYYEDRRRFRVAINKCSCVYCKGHTVDIIESSKKELVCMISVDSYKEIEEIVESTGIKITSGLEEREANATRTQS